MPTAGFGEVAERLRRSTVQLTVGRRGSGSGVAVEPDGVVVTNAHVAASTPIEARLWDGTRARAEVISRDTGRDLAALRLAGSKLPTVTLADSNRVRVGELVIAVGNPLGFLGALTTGVVHAVGRVRGLGPGTWIQADVQLAPGNSGGPLADAEGRLVGINTMVAGGIGLAVPSNAVSRFLAGRAARAPLGVVVRAVEVRLDGRPRMGLLVMEVVRGGAAERASLMQGDVLIGADGRALDSIEDLEQALDGAAGGTVRVRFVRGGRETVRSAVVRLGDRGAAAA